MARFLRLFCQITLIGFLLGQTSFVYAQDEQAGATPTPTLTVEPLPPVMEISSQTDEDGTPEGLALAQEMDSLLIGLFLEQRNDDSHQESLDALRQAGVLIEGDLVQVQIAVDPASQAAVTDFVTQLGGAVTGISSDEQWLQGLMPIPGLASLSQNPLVNYVRHPISVLPAQDPGDVTSSEALVAFNVAAWRESGRDGEGVHIAVIDSGFAGYSELLGNELPQTITGANFVDFGPAQDIEGLTVHGTEVAEIIHDVAPAASLSLLRINTNIDLKEAVQWAIRHNVDIIATSIGWYNLGPGDGTGELADLVSRAHDAGILWVTAAGNDRERHWGGIFVDNDGDSRHEYAASQEVQIFGPQPNQAYMIPAGYPLVVHLRWSDWTDVAVDLNLELVRFDGKHWQTVAHSQNPQNGEFGQTPTEAIYHIAQGAPAPYGVVITHRGGVIDRPINMDLFAPKNLGFSHPVYEHSLNDLADVELAITVGAIDATDSYLPEIYSAEGPTNGPGGVQTGGILKPDLVAYTNVTTASSQQRFNGTSAATPHVAGAAVLVKNAYPDWTPAQIRDFLLTRAQPLPAEVATAQTRIGRGRLALGTPPSRLQGSNISVDLSSSRNFESSELLQWIEIRIEIVNSTSLPTSVSLAHPIVAGVSLLETPWATVDSQPTVEAGQLRWQGDVPAHSSVVFIYEAAVEASSEQAVRILTTALLSGEDGDGLSLSAFLNPVDIFLPILAR